MMLEMASVKSVCAIWSKVGGGLVAEPIVWKMGFAVR